MINTVRLFLFILLLGSASWAQAAAPFISGGVSAEERAQIDAAADQYNVKVTFADRKDNSYLSAVEVTVTETLRNRLAVQTLTKGPFLLMNLPQGDYILEAVSNGRKVRQELKVQNAKTDTVVTL